MSAVGAHSLVVTRDEIVLGFGHLERGFLRVEGLWISPCDISNYSEHTVRLAITAETARLMRRNPSLDPLGIGLPPL